MNNPNLVGLYVGVAFGIIFFLYGVLFCKKIPTFNQVAIVVLALTGAVVGLNLGFIALTADDSLLGILKDQRIAVVLGALAVVWTSVETFFGSVSALRISTQGEMAEQSE